MASKKAGIWPHDPLPIPCAPPPIPPIWGIIRCAARGGEMWIESWQHHTGPPLSLHSHQHPRSHHHLYHLDILGYWHIRRSTHPRDFEEPNCKCVVPKDMMWWSGAIEAVTMWCVIAPVWWCQRAGWGWWPLLGAGIKMHFSTSTHP